MYFNTLPQITQQHYNNLTPPPRDITETIDVKNQNVIGRLLCIYILYRYSPALKAYAFPRPPKKRGSGEKTDTTECRAHGRQKRNRSKIVDVFYWFYL